MMTMPIYDMMMLPDITFYFKRDIFEKMGYEEVSAGEDILFIMLKSDKEQESLSEDDFYPVGISGKIEAVDEEGNYRIHTGERVDFSDFEIDGRSIQASASIRPDIEDLTAEEEKKIYDRIQRMLLNYVRNFQWGALARNYFLHWKSVGEILCAVSGYLGIPWEDKYQILETDSRKERCELIEHVLRECIEINKISEEAETAQKESNEQLYREAAIKKQIDILQKQLDAMHPENVSDVRRFELKLSESGMGEEARREADKVLNRMKQEGKDSHEYGALYDYLDFVTTLAWKMDDPAPVDLDEAEKILDEDHYGLKKVKERIVQQLAVMALNKKQSGSVLLFVGAPGTGKTSIGQSIARALHREYVRISLGGIRDEAEIRGHRRTYIGAMPGRIMQGMERAGVMNPVMVLDEGDKLSRDYAGDPSSALLEVLDPEQNNTFTDHYMNVPYDLSNVLFVCTANTVDTIPEPLLNRMEVIQFPGYTPVEKFQIARRHLLPKAMNAMGIKAQMLKVTDGAIRRMISGYTAESGVRGLKKQLDTLCRYAAVKLVKGEQKSITVSEKRLPQFLGRNEIYHERVMEQKEPGVVTGLAWTAAGGEILFVETSLSKGTGQVTITGQLGDVMKESAEIALSLVKHLYPGEAQKLEKSDLHIHVPSGAVPKDGPSAGITLTTALASLLTGKPVDPYLAMTGEISLTGRVMPIGGLPEKLMAAQRAGVKRVLIPKENVEDLEDVAEEVKSSLEIIPVQRAQEVLQYCLLTPEKKKA